MSTWVPHRPSFWEMTVKRSKFIGMLAFIEPNTQPRAFQGEAEAHYKGANHYCWAYRLQWPSVDEASSDAGEPSGTAGRPILQAMQKAACVQAIVIVARFFGGIKLGVRGLIDAYGEAAAGVMLAADRARPLWCTEYSGSVPYAEIGTFNYWFEKQGLSQSLLSVDYQQEVDIKLKLPDDARGAFDSFLASWSSRGHIWLTSGDRRELVRI